MRSHRPSLPSARVYISRSNHHQHLSNFFIGPSCSLGAPHVGLLPTCVGKWTVWILTRSHSTWHEAALKQRQHSQLVVYAAIITNSIFCGWSRSAWLQRGFHSRVENMSFQTVLTCMLQSFSADYGAVGVPLLYIIPLLQLLLEWSKFDYLLNHPRV